MFTYGANLRGSVMFKAACVLRQNRVLGRDSLLCKISFTLFMSGCLSIQASDSPKTFEVASVKRAQASSGVSPSIRGGPGSSIPGEFIATNVSLKDLLLTAFELNAYQLAGPPWLAVEHYEVIAKVTPGTSKKDCQLMQQALLVERFGLKFHRGVREITGMALTVDKGGPKIKDVSNDDISRDHSGQGTPKAPTGPAIIGKDGLLVVAPGETRVSWYKGGLTDGIIAANAPIGRVATVLSQLLKMEVIDQTGLAGKYTFRFDFLRPDRDPQTLRDVNGRPASDMLSNINVADLFTSVREHLGLRLIRQKMQINMLYIDYADKIPVDN